MKRRKDERRAGGGTSVATAVLAAGVGLLTGLAAHAGARGLAVAAEPLSGHWLDIAKGDHLMILEAMERARDSKTRGKAQRAVQLARIRDAFARHSLWEEMIVYPALRFNDQEAAANEVCTGHAQTKAALFELERLGPEDPEWKSQLVALTRAFELQARREEEELFPALRRAITPEEDVRLTSLVNQLNRRFV